VHIIINTVCFLAYSSLLVVCQNSGPAWYSFRWNVPWGFLKMCCVKSGEW